MKLPRLVIAATHSGAGKTSLCAALMAAFVRRGLAVVPYKTGPDYIDPSFHTRITGRPSINLDAWLLPPFVLRDLFARRFFPLLSAAPPDTPPLPSCIGVVEGVMGLFDGQGSGHQGSTAHVAELLHAPVLLVINGKGLSRSAAALVKGYARFSPDLAVSGVIVNRAGEKLYALLKNIIEEQAGVPCFGHLPDDPAFALPARRLGLVPADELETFDTVVTQLADAAERCLDLSGLLALADSAPEMEETTTPHELPENASVCRQTWEEATHPHPLPESGSVCRQTSHDKLPAASIIWLRKHSPVRIGVARDQAFSFYYQDNLDLLRELGAELIPFSPLRDAALPARLHGLYLGGGAVEAHAEKLEANRAFRADIRQALENGLPAYAEDGGLVYLCSGLVLRDSGSDSDIEKYINNRIINSTISLLGFFPYSVRMGTSLQHFGYVEAALTRDTLLGPAGTTFRAHEFHYSFLDIPPDTAPSFACRVRKPGGENAAKGWSDGLVKNQVYAAYAHLHFYSNPAMARHFLLACRRY